jgi:hypothetical protein
MRFFTREWWASAPGDPQDAFAAYELHFQAIKGVLPPDLVDLHAHHTLHDARVQDVERDVAGGTLALVLDGWDRALRHRVRYTLSFSDVGLFERTDVPDGDEHPARDDLGYWECDVSGDAIEMRMLFASDAEYRIVFRDMVFTHAVRTGQ